MNEPTPAERIANKQAETKLRKTSRRKEALWRSLFSHAVGIIYILAEFSLGYKPDLRHIDKT